MPTTPATKHHPHLHATNPDRYRNCHNTCTHDVSRGVLTQELIGPKDGPHTSDIAVVLWPTR